VKILSATCGLVFMLAALVLTVLYLLATYGISVGDHDATWFVSRAAFYAVAALCFDRGSR
jgi:hypothetical protein